MLGLVARQRDLDVLLIPWNRVLYSQRPNIAGLFNEQRSDYNTPVEANRFELNIFLGILDLS